MTAVLLCMMLLIPALAWAASDKSYEGDDGSQFAPTFTFRNSTNTGIFRNKDAQELDFSVNGVVVFRLNQSGIVGGTPGVGTVTSITALSPLTGGTITGSGSIGLGNLPISVFNNGTNASNTTCWRGDATWAPCSAGGGTVTNTAGSLTSNSLLIGNGGNDAKVLPTVGSATSVLHGTTPPSWSPIDLTADVTNTLAINRGGTNATSANAALNNLLPSQASNATKVLTTDGTNTSWQAGGGGGGGGNVSSAGLTIGTLPKASGATNLVDSLLSESGSTIAIGSGNTGALSAGSLQLNGTVSGAVSVLPQGAAGTYNFNLPTTAGSAGQVLASGGGGGAPMVWQNSGAGSVTTTGSVTINNLAKFSGAASITNAAATDDGSSFTYTGASGVTANGFVSNGSSDGSLKLTNISGLAHSVTLQVGNPSADRTWTLPIADGTNGQFIQTNGSGVLSFATPAGSGTVTTTGSPASGNLTKFSGATSITNGDLAGDATTSGTLTTTVAKVNGVSYAASPSTHQVPVVTASNTTTYKTLPDCQDTGGNHLNYTQSSDAFSCGTSGGGAGSVAMARVTHNTTQTVNSSTNAALAFNTDVQNPNGLHSTVTNNSRITNNTGSTKTCMMSATASVTFSSGPTGDVVLNFLLNGATILDANELPVISANVTYIVNVSSIRQLSNNDYVEVQVRNEATQNLTVNNSSEYTPVFSMICQ